MILLCEYNIGSNNHALAFVILGCCYRLMRLLGLDERGDSTEELSNSELSKLETSKRLVWSCYILDGLMATGVDANSCWSERYPCLRFPAPDTVFITQDWSEPHHTVSIDAFEASNVRYPLDLRASIIYLMRLRTLAHRQGLRLEIVLRI
jgi:hypothetical protein